MDPEARAQRIAEIRARVAELRAQEVITAAELDELRSLKGEFDTLRTADEAAAIADAIGDEPEAEPEATEAEPEAPTDEPAAEPEAAPEAAAPRVTAEEALAAASAAEPAAEATPETEVPQRARLVASAHAEGAAAGSDMQWQDFQRIMRGASGIAKSGGSAERRYGNIQRHFGGDMLSDRNNASENTRILNAAAQRTDRPLDLITAACFCGPDQADNSINRSGIDARPVAGAFNSVPVQGRFRYIPDVTFADVAAGTQQWTCTDQDAVDPDVPSTWKPCVDLACQTDITVEPYMVPACATIDITTQLSNPELVDAFLSKLGVVHARLAETLLLDQIVATSHYPTIAAGSFGLLWELERFLSGVHGIASYELRENPESYVMMVPPGMLDLLVADQHLRGAQQPLNKSDIIRLIQESYGVRVQEILDIDTAHTALYPTSTAAWGALGVATPFAGSGNLPDQFVAYILDPSDYSHGMSDLVEAGYRTDGNLTRQNRVQWFTEGTEFLEKRGQKASITLQIDSCANGAASAMVAPPACT